MYRFVRAAMAVITVTLAPALSAIGPGGISGTGLEWNALEHAKGHVALPYDPPYMGHPYGKGTAYRAWGADRPWLYPDQGPAMYGYHWRQRYPSQSGYVRGRGGAGRPTFHGVGPSPGYGDRGQRLGYGRGRYNGRGMGPDQPAAGPRQEYFHRLSPERP
jgi:hypothetical protein